MSFQPVPTSWGDMAEMVRKLAHAVNQIGVWGRSNATGTFTLTASTTSTVVSDRRVGTDSVITLMPTTANAAAALGTTYISVTAESFTVTHANNAQSDRTFGYLIQG